VAARKKKLGPQDFDMTTILGEGSYAKVFLATSKADGKQFAAKVVDKQHVIRFKKVKAVMNEKRVLSQCDHPSIVHLHSAFQNRYSFFFLLELVEGGELFDLIQRKGKLEEDLARFFCAEIFNTLQYLHRQGILHRDLKPENLLVTSSRHLKLTDFGTAATLTPVPPPSTPNLDSNATEGKDWTEKEKKTDSVGGVVENAVDDDVCAVSSVAATETQFVGTAEYVAPEILDAKVGRWSENLRAQD
jgi:serine/threonine protein kinase